MVSVVVNGWITHTVSVVSFAHEGIGVVLFRSNRRGGGGGGRVFSIFSRVRISWIREYLKTSRFRTRTFRSQIHIFVVCSFRKCVNPGGNYQGEFSTLENLCIKRLICEFDSWRGNSQYACQKVDKEIYFSAISRKIFKFLFNYARTQLLRTYECAREKISWRFRRATSRGSVRVSPIFNRQLTAT